MFYQTIHYQYSINDDNGNKQSKRESIRNTTVSGKYKILLPDGRLQIVTYTASKNGFKPKIKYEIPKEAQTNRLGLKPVEVSDKHDDNNDKTQTKRGAINGDIVLGDCRILLPDGRAQVIVCKVIENKFQPRISYIIHQTSVWGKLQSEKVADKVIQTKLHNIILSTNQGINN